MGATVIFWTPICASRPRLGSGRLLPRRGKSRPRRAGALARRVGALTRLIMKRYRSLLGSSAADGADESSGAIIRVSQGGSTFNPRAACGPLSTTAKVEDG